jgi:hypothetical protein
VRTKEVEIGGTCSKHDSCEKRKELSRKLKGSRNSVVVPECARTRCNEGLFRV